MITYSLYIHYPFCVRRCPYCGFATQVDRRNQAEHYRRALITELRRRLTEEPWRGGEVASIYFGGGTPSLMPPEFCSSLLQFVNSSLHQFQNRRTDKLTNQNSKFRNPKSEIEITLEANPTTRDAKNFRAFHESGVNRLSIGAQSFQPGELKLLGRWHSPDDVADTVRLAREAGFDNVSLDLIYGVPGQTVESFASSVRRALALGIEHLSTYTLSIEEGTPFATRVKEGRLPVPSSDLAADQYASLIEIMRDAGYEHYELTNYAQPDKWSRHNFAYWERIPYLGVGLGAHSFDGRRRFWNTRELGSYLSLLDGGQYPVDGEEILDERQILQEQVYLDLRTRSGIGRETAQAVFNRQEMGRMLERGILEERGERIHIANRHWLLLDEIVINLLQSGRD